MPRMKTYGAVAALLLLIAVGGYLYYRPIENGTREKPEPTPVEGWPQPGDVVFPPPGTLRIVTWNVRGYPEETKDLQTSFSFELQGFGAHVMCIQEIADQESVEHFIANENAYRQVVFADTADDQDNAIFSIAGVSMEHLPHVIPIDAGGRHGADSFQHSPQTAFVADEGFDAVVMTVHLSWTDRDQREVEKRLLKGAVQRLLERDPDLIICGCFNANERAVRELAEALGMVVMVPEGQNGVGTTHEGNRYDHFLISPDCANEEAKWCRILTLSESREMAREISDHLPVIAGFRTDGEFRDRYTDHGVVVIRNGGHDTAMDDEFKDWELYSWQEDDGGPWRFSLLTGTNRTKSLDEVKARAIVGVAVLKKVLTSLAEGETVMWLHRPIGSVSEEQSRPLSYPSEEVVEDLIQYCAELGIRLVVTADGDQR